MRSAASVRQQGAATEVQQQVTRDAAQGPLARLAVAIGAGHHEVGGHVLDDRLQLSLAAPSEGCTVASDRMPCASIQSATSATRRRAAAASFFGAISRISTRAASFSSGSASSVARRASRVSCQATTTRSSASVATSGGTTRTGRPACRINAPRSGSRVSRMGSVPGAPTMRRSASRACAARYSAGRVRVISDRHPASLPGAPGMPRNSAQARSISPSIATRSCSTRSPM